MEQLSNLPTNMPEDLRIQAQIELRMLRVLNFQRQLRSEVFKILFNGISIYLHMNNKLPEFIIHF